jgi:aspartyl-tRNA(Asn)/glutamyl-tRNA(Gln) amidotransferase subunit C
MKIDQEKIAHLARLSRLQFSPEEALAIEADLNRMLTFVEELNAVDTNGVDALSYISDGEQMPREDKSFQLISTEEALKNASNKDLHYFRVPKIIQ